jgi:hypothetical protein
VTLTSVGRRLQVQSLGPVEELVGPGAQEPGMAQCHLTVDEDLIRIGLRRTADRRLAALRLVATSRLGIRRPLPQLVEDPPLSAYGAATAIHRVALLGGAVLGRAPLVSRSWVVGGLHGIQPTPVSRGAHGSDRACGRCR